MSAADAEQAHWERVLAAEGLGERSLFEPSFGLDHRNVVVFVSENAGPAARGWAEQRSIEIHGAPVAWHELAGAEVWQTLEAQAQTLPMPDARDLIVSLCQDGNLSQAARRCGVSRSRARWLLAVANSHWRTLSARTAPKDSVRPMRVVRVAA